MTEENIVSRRGVYKDLTQSPYEYRSPYGDVFKFRSKKKLEVYTRDIENELERLTRFLLRSGLDNQLGYERTMLLYRRLYHAFYLKKR